MNSYALIWNLGVEGPLVLGPGLTLRPLSTEISIFDLSATGAAGFNEWGVLGPMAAKLRSEIESAGDAAAAPGYDTQSRGWLRLNLQPRSAVAHHYEHVPQLSIVFFA